VIGSYAIGVPAAIFSGFVIHLAVLEVFGSRALEEVVLGTTISPYLLFWQSGEEVEQMESEPKEKPLENEPPTSTGTTPAD
jgi:hypothetical protein